MARQAIVGSFAVLLTVIASGRAQAQQFACCREVCGSGVVNCELPLASDCAASCAGFCGGGGSGSPCISATVSTCPDGHNPLNCDEGCQAVCPATQAPTLTPWGLIAAVLFLVSAGGLTLRRRMRGR